MRIVDVERQGMSNTKFSKSELGRETTTNILRLVLPGDTRAVTSVLPGVVTHGAVR